MEFGLEKCAIVVMKSGKRQIAERIEQSNQETFELLEKRKTTSTKEYWKRTQPKESS